ncbi:kinase domain-containing [Cordyceps militaris]|uniref:Kinase domain-containing n=1 Tax=Cordyceps militaris TaxID=73501 RepID=A0A2H4S5T5_CORMI|nr:kinase domain-containing [Cordyceps militaris]
MVIEGGPVPPCLQKYTFINGGSTGWVFGLTDDIVLKYARPGRMDSFLAENAIYDKLERSDRPASLMQSLLRRPGFNFMPRMVQSLDERLHANQGRLEPVATVGRWAAEVSEAMAWLARHGLVHGDLRPPNMLLDARDHLVLADFNLVARIGDVHGSASWPWAHRRVCTSMTCKDPSGCPARYGHHGAATEQFSLGSVLYNLIRGVELGGSEAEHMVKGHLVMPVMGDAPLGRFVQRCWNGEFAELAELAREAKRLEGAEDAGKGTGLGTADMRAARARCERFLEEELAEIVPHEESEAAQGLMGTCEPS